jgi:hypothetical protein
MCSNEISVPAVATAFAKRDLARQMDGARSTANADSAAHESGQVNANAVQGLPFLWDQNSLADQVLNTAYHYLINCVQVKDFSMDWTNVFRPFPRTV